MHRIKPAALPVDTGHGAYERTAPPRPWEPGWQLAPAPATGPEVDMIVLQAHLAAVQNQLEELARLDEPTRAVKRKCVGLPGCPPEAA